MTSIQKVLGSIPSVSASETCEQTLQRQEQNRAHMACTRASET